MRRKADKLIYGMRLLQENGLFRLLYKPPLLHSVNSKNDKKSCVSAYEMCFPDDCRRFRDAVREARASELDFADVDADEAGLLYRLDFPTSGLVVFAKDPVALRKLRRAKIVKTYSATCSFSGKTLGGLRLPEEYGKASRKLAQTGKLDFKSFFRSYAGKSVRPVLESELCHCKGKDIVLRQYETEIVSQGGGFDRVEGERLDFDVRIVRGFRHQIRSVLSSLSYPIAGDSQYGGKALDGCALADGAIGLVCRRLDFCIDGVRYGMELTDEI